MHPSPSSRAPQTQLMESNLWSPLCLYLECHRWHGCRQAQAGSAAASVMIAQQLSCMLEGGNRPPKSAQEVGARADENTMI